MEAIDPYNDSANATLLVFPQNNEPYVAQTLEDLSVFALESIYEPLDLDAVFQDLD